MNIIRSTSGVLAVGIMAAACTTSPPTQQNASINEATQAVDRAAGNPQVAKNAPAELMRAQDSLRQAKGIWQAKGDAAQATHFAYLARQQAATAEYLANERIAKDVVTAAAAQRSQLVASAHANAARASAQSNAVAKKTDQQLQQELSGLPAQTTRRGIVVILPQSRFAFDDSTVPADTMSMMDRLATVLKNNPERKIVIEGFTDSSGDKEYNLSLAEERADAVRSELIRRGIDGQRIISRSYGSDYPVASNNTAEGRRENRRAEIIISNPEGYVADRSSSGTFSTSGQ